MKTTPSLSPETIAKYRQTFQQRTQARFEAREKRRQQAQKAVDEAIRAIMPRYPSVRRVYLFGSVVKLGAFGPNSDVDIGIEGADMALCFDIWRELEWTVPEWRLDVRSLDLEDAFTERVRLKGELVYERPPANP